MTMLNPQAIVAGLGRPLTPEEARAIMRYNSQSSGTLPQGAAKVDVSEPKPDGPTLSPKQAKALAALEGVMSTTEVADAAGLKRNAVCRLMAVLENKGFVEAVRGAGGRGNANLWSRVERNRGSGK